MNSSKIYVAGSSGMVGSAVVRKLQSENYNNIVTSRSKDLDCRNQADVDSFFAKHKFDVVVTAIPKFTSNCCSFKSLVTVKDPKNGAAIISNVDPVSPSVLTPTVDIATVTLLLTDNP